MPHLRWHAPGAVSERKKRGALIEWRLPLDVSDVAIDYRDPLAEEAEFFERLMQELAHGDDLTDERSEERRPVVWHLPPGLSVGPR